MPCGAERPVAGALRGVWVERSRSWPSGTLMVGAYPILVRRQPWLIARRHSVIAGLALRRYRVQELPLQAGDRLVFLADGMLERNAAAVDAMSILTASSHLHPREAVQGLPRRVVAACGGNLRDDATILCLDWHGGPPRLRQASEGADH